MNFKEAIGKLEGAGRLKRVDVPYSTNLEMAELIKSSKTAVLFDYPDSDYKVAASICTRENLPEIYELDRAELRNRMLEAIENPIKPVKVEEHNFVEEKVDLNKLPILKHFKEDAGNYITAGVFFAESPKHGRNLSYHRTLVLGKNKATLRLTHRDLWAYYNEAGKELKVAICIGLDPAILLAASVSVGIDKDEIEIASSFNKQPVELVELDGISVPKDSEIVLLGKLTKELADEGPFVDMTGTLDFKRKQPVFKVEKIFRQETSIYHALVPALNEHRFLMGFSREPVIFKEVSKICKCTDVVLTNSGMNWLHCAVSIEKNKEEDVKKVIEAVLKAHTSVKHVFVVDPDIDVLDSDELEWALATRFQGDKDLYNFPGSKGSSLDPSATKGEDRRTTCKVGFDCTIPVDKNKKEFVKVE